MFSCDTMVVNASRSVYGRNIFAKTATGRQVSRGRSLGDSVL